MGKRKVSYVNENSINDNIGRASLRARTLSGSGASDAKVEQARKKLDDLKDARSTMQGRAFGGKNGSGLN